MNNNVMNRLEKLKEVLTFVSDNVKQSETIPELYFFEVSNFYFDLQKDLKKENFKMTRIYPCDSGLRCYVYDKQN